MNPTREEALFALAREKSADERAAFLARECAVTLVCASASRRCSPRMNKRLALPQPRLTAPPKSIPPTKFEPSSQNAR
jgi:hypothetical protein